MDRKDAKEVAEYIAQALGKTGINIKLCTSRLEHYTHGIPIGSHAELIQTAYKKNQKSPAEATNYLYDILLQNGIDNPVIWWRAPVTAPRD